MIPVMIIVKTAALNFQGLTKSVTFIQLIIYVVNILNDSCAICAPTVLSFLKRSGNPDEEPHLTFKEHC